jgi:hypothetical protein
MTEEIHDQARGRVLGGAEFFFGDVTEIDADAVQMELVPRMRSMRMSSTARCWATMRGVFGARFVGVLRGFFGSAEIE